MLNFRSMAKSASRRKETLESKITAARADLAAMEKELKVLEAVLDALPKGAETKGLGRPRGSGKRRKGGRWRTGKPGRPPKWFIEQQKAKGKGKSAKPAKKAIKAKPVKRKKKASEKQLAAMAKAREALAAKRAAQAAAPKPE